MSALPPTRLLSIDAYRGLVMTLMMAEVLRLPAVAKYLPTSEFWQFLAFHQSHVEWVGCSLHDLIQPSFTFLVGVALPFSLAARRAKGYSDWASARHAFSRSLILILLGIFLRSVGKPQANFTYEDTLTQIGLGYPFLFLLGLARPWLRWLGLVAILVGYWAFFTLHPLPGPDMDWSVVGVPSNWPHHADGFAGHWEKNANAASHFDIWFLNQFPRPKPFTFNGGGYTTLSFIPTLGTMVLGLLAGDVLKSDRRGWSKVGILAGAGIIALLMGYGLGAAGVCPVVKRIWTPSWVLFSGGWCLLFLAGFSAILDVGRRTSWAFPLLVVGANSIAAYVLDGLAAGFFRDLLRLLPAEIYNAFGPEYEPFILGCGVFAILWLILFAMYRKKVFVKI